MEYVLLKLTTGEEIISGCLDVVVNKNDYEGEDVILLHKPLIIGRDPQGKPGMMDWCMFVKDNERVPLNRSMIMVKAAPHPEVIQSYKSIVSPIIQDKSSIIVN